MDLADDIILAASGLFLGNIHDHIISEESHKKR